MWQPLPAPEECIIQIAVPLAAMSIEQIVLPEGVQKEDAYKALLPQLKALLGDEKNVVACTANLVAALKEAFGFYWIGLYFVYAEEKELVLGPFQGPPACIRIPFGKGVCGTAWKKREAIIVPDVQLFSGHIACSPHTKSEIVVPVWKGEDVKAVIDIDSTELSFFDDVDKRYLIKIAEIISPLL